MTKYVQDFLPNFLDCKEDAREELLDKTTSQVHLAREFIRYDKMIKLCKNEHTKKMLEKCKQETLKLMQRI